MARPRAPGYDAQRELILETAAAAFAELGFPSASMSDIAARCGMSKGLLYHYYASKEQLLFDVTDQYTRRLVAIVEDVERRVEDAAARLREFVFAFLGEYETSQTRHMVLLHDLRFLPPEQAAVVVRNERQVVDAFARAVAGASGLPANAPELKPVTMMLFGMINWTFTWMEPAADGRQKAARRLSYEEYAEMVDAVFRGGVGAVRSGSGAAPATASPKAENRRIRKRVAG